MSMLFEHSSAPLRTIKEIQFGLFSPEEIKAMSVCHVIHAETMVCSLCEMGRGAGCHVELA